MSRAKVRPLPGGQLPSSAGSLLVQRPPPGPFGAKAIVWTRLAALKRRGELKCDVAVVPNDRVADFVEGMGLEAGSNKPVLRKTTVKADTSHHLSYLCQRAIIRRALKPLKAAAGKRGVAQLKGCQELLKCGCKAAFDVTLYGDGFAPPHLAKQWAHPHGHAGGGVVPRAPEGQGPEGEASLPALCAPLPAYTTTPLGSTCAHARSCGW